MKIQINEEDAKRHMQLNPDRGGAMDADMVDVKEIVKEYLIKNKFDGLWSDECACEISDLIPCEDSWGFSKCKPGYKFPCPESCGEHDFHIGEKKEGK